MDPNVVTLIIGLAGIASTLISSGLGIYYTAKARSAPLREMLYSKQVELISKLIYKQGRFRVYATVLSDETSIYGEQARDDIGNCVKEYAELTEEGAAILPTDLWIEVKQLSSAMSGLVVDYDASGKIDKDRLVELIAIEAKLSLIARAVLGVDKLTDESLQLFSSTKEFERLAKLESHTLEAMVREKNA
jgi:hypothetical protein